MASSETESKLTPFGAPMLKHFLFANGYKNFNHGSFGTYPRSVQDTLRKYQEEAEGHPDIFYRWGQSVALDKSREAIAKLLGASTKECVFVKNATTGVDTVLRNLTFKDGDVIVYFATVYGAVENAVVSLSETTPVKGVKVDYQLPISHDELVRRFRDVVTKAKADGLNVRVTIFDTIISQPAIRFPFERLIEACKLENILSLVDGAHAVGQIPLDLDSLQPDFFVSNCYKWLYTPRGCAVLYVPLRNQHILRTTLPTSWGFISSLQSPSAPGPLTSQVGGKSAFELLFESTATTDNAPYFTVPAAMKFRQEVCGGEDRIYQYLETLAREAGDIIATALGTEVMQEPDLSPGEESQFRRCAMSTIRLPLSYHPKDNNHSSSNDNKKNKSPYLLLSDTEAVRAAEWMQSTLVNRYKTMVPLLRYGGSFWVRISAQIYLQKSDFEWLAGVLKELCEKVGKREIPAESMPIVAGKL